MKGAIKEVTNEMNGGSRIFSIDSYWYGTVVLGIWLYPDGDVDISSVYFRFRSRKANILGCCKSIRLSSANKTAVLTIRQRANPCQHTHASGLSVANMWKNSPTVTALPNGVELFGRTCLLAWVNYMRVMCFCRIISDVNCESVESSLNSNSLFTNELGQKLHDLQRLE